METNGRGCARVRTTSYCAQPTIGARLFGRLSLRYINSKLTSEPPLLRLPLRFSIFQLRILPLPLKPFIFLIHQLLVQHQYLTSRLGTSSAVQVSQTSLLCLYSPTELPYLSLLVFVPLWSKMSAPNDFYSAQLSFGDDDYELFNFDPNNLFGLDDLSNVNVAGFGSSIPNDGQDLDSFTEDDVANQSSVIGIDEYTSSYLQLDGDASAYQDTGVDGFADNQFPQAGLEPAPEYVPATTEAEAVQSPVPSESPASEQHSPEPETPLAPSFDPDRTITKSPSPQPPNPQTSKATTDDEGGYVCQPHVPSKFYPAYRAVFADSATARAHRRLPKHKSRPASDINDALRRRDFWVKRIYESMVDVSVASDGKTSWQYKRFGTQSAYDPDDLEAAAHNVFDRALAVHRTGWTRPLIYQKVAVRGKRQDKGGESVLHRLEAICAVLQQSKAAVDEAIQGGLKLARLCYNPYERKVGKKGNQSANINKASQIAAGKAALAAKNAAAEQTLGEGESEDVGADENETVE